MRYLNNDGTFVQEPSNTKWNYNSNNDGSFDGFNDSGIETFKGDPVCSFVREDIQNSVDGAKQEGELVTVEFNDFLVKPNEIPCLENFKEILRSCKEMASGTEPKAEAFFDNALNKVNDELSIIRISDFGTTGLEGADTDENGHRYYKLIKARGSSNNSGNAGGCFGIGKYAPFAISDLRTVFYSTRIDGKYYSIGKSCLMSHKEADHITVGTGFFTNMEKLKAMPYGISLDPNFVRRENGTDIYILGASLGENFKKRIIEVVLHNFFITIYEGKLVVKYKDIVIDKDNLGRLIVNLDDNDANTELKEYYKLLTANISKDDETTKVFILDKNEFGKEYGINDGECILYLRKGYGFNRRIYMTRKVGMKLFEQTNISGQIQFTGILRIIGDKMNNIFQKMENPAHNAWEEFRSPEYKDAYRKLRKYLINKVRESFSHTEQDTIDIADLEKFFAGTDCAETEVKKNAIGEQKIHVGIRRGNSNRGKRSKVLVKGTPDDVDTEDLISVEPIAKHKERKKITEPPVPVPNPPVPNPTKPIPTPDPVMIPNPISTENPQKVPDDIRKLKYKFVNVRKGLRDRNIVTGDYTLTFRIPGKKKHVKLEFVAIGETSNMKLELANVRVNERGLKCYYEKNIVYLDGVRTGSLVYLDFNINFNMPVMLEVDYSEA